MKTYTLPSKAQSRKVRLNKMVEMQNYNMITGKKNMDLLMQCTIGYSDQVNRLLKFVQGSKNIKRVEHEEATGMVKEIQKILLKINSNRNKFYRNSNNSAVFQIMLQPYQYKLKEITNDINAFIIKTTEIC